MNKKDWATACPCDCEACSNKDLKKMYGCGKCG
jgi:hypothetical protein